METRSIPRTLLPFLSPSLSPPTKPLSQFPISTPIPYQNHTHWAHFPPLSATLNSRRGFGPSPKKSKRPKNQKKKKKGYDSDDNEEEEEEEEDEEEEDQGVIPEIVTNRMISRMGFSVGIPLFTGVLFFPFFYYLRVGLKIDVPNWVPFIVSFVFFGTALVGVSYGIVSSSWDPLREGSLLGWKEARKNWPVFWQSIRGRSGNKVPLLHSLLPLLTKSSIVVRSFNFRQIEFPKQNLCYSEPNRTHTGARAHDDGRNWVGFLYDAVGFQQ